MLATTTDLPLEPVENIPAALHTVLKAVGLSDTAATNITRMLPPAGQRAMLVAIHRHPYGLRDLVTDFIGDVADRLRITWAEAAIIRSELSGVTR